MKKNKKKGFTIFEIIFVVGLFAFLGAISLPFTMDAYRHYLLSSETQIVVTILRRAEDMAIANKYGDSFGISVQDTQYVLFRGTSYLNRDPSFDEVYEKTSSVNISPLGDIIFNSISGKPLSVITLTLSASNSSQRIDINSQGTINW